MKKIVLIISILFVTIYSNSNSQGWEKLFGDESYYHEIYQIAVNSRNEIFILAENINQDTSFFLFVSKDDGKTLESKKLKYPFFDELFYYGRYRFFQCIRINHSDDIFIATDSILICSTDNGESFQTVLDNLKLEKIFGSGYEKNYPSHIYFDFAPNDDIYISCLLDDDVPSTNDSHIIKSTDKGNSWEIVSLNTIRFVKLSFDTNGTVYTAYPWSAYKSVDTCKTWLEIDLDSIILYNSLIGWPVVLDIDNKGNIYVLSEGNSVVKSTDGGLNWTAVYEIGGSSGMNSYEIKCIRDGWIFSPSGYSLDYGNTWKKHGALSIYCTDSTCYSILIKRFIGRFNPTLSEVEHLDITLSNFTIIPNPASEFIEINVVPQLSESYHFQIYNIFGENMPVGAGSKPAITGTIRIDVSNFQSGIYFFRLGNEIQKFVVLR